jgi:FMN phosphatase YigB (HAD superfamily)
LAKPDPAFFRHALAALGAAPEEAWMIGDDEAHDLAPARALGMGTHGVHVDAGRSEAPLATLIAALTNALPQ